VVPDDGAIHGFVVTYTTTAWGIRTGGVLNVLMLVGPKAHAAYCSGNTAINSYAGTASCCVARQRDGQRLEPHTADPGTVVHTAKAQAPPQAAAPATPTLTTRGVAYRCDGARALVSALPLFVVRGRRGGPAWKALNGRGHEDRDNALHRFNAGCGVCGGRE